MGFPGINSISCARQHAMACRRSAEACVTMTQSSSMRLLGRVAQANPFCGLVVAPIIVFCSLWSGFCGTSAAQTNDDPITVSAEHPRLLLRPARLKLLKRELERSSARWRQFQTRVEAGPALPEPGFALALYYQVSGDMKDGHQALTWALRPRAELRRQRLVFVS